MYIWQAVILGIVEGITEFLPISSTGHLILTSYILGIPRSDFLSTFEIAIQSGAIVAVILVYWKRILGSKKLMQLLLLSFLPAALLGIFLYRPIKNILFGNAGITVAALITGGIIFLLLELRLKLKNHAKTKEQLTPFKAILIGIGQSLSIIPGVSRSASTMFSGMLTGLSRKEAVEYSFLLAIPTILAATGYDLLKSSPIISQLEINLLIVGAFSAFISAYIAIRWFIHFISSHTFVPFAIYRIAAGIIFALFFL